MNSLRQIIKDQHITSAVLSEVKRKALAEKKDLVTNFKWKTFRVGYNTHGLRKLGLWRDDVRNEIDPVVAEAIRRLPQKLMEERKYRIARAEFLYNSKAELPKEEWTKWEDDVLYLEPYIEEVREEMKTREG